MHLSPRMLRVNKQRPLMFAEPCSVKMVYWAMVYSPWVCSMAAHAECRQFYCMLLLLLSNQATWLLQQKTGIPPSHHTVVRLLILLLLPWPEAESRANFPSDKNTRSKLFSPYSHLKKKHMESSQMHTKGGIFLLSKKIFLLSFQFYN